MILLFLFAFCNAQKWSTTGDPFNKLERKRAKLSRDMKKYLDGNARKGSSLCSLREQDNRCCKGVSLEQGWARKHFFCFLFLPFFSSFPGEFLLSFFPPFLLSHLSREKKVIFLSGRERKDNFLFLRKGKESFLSSKNKFYLRLIGH